VIDNNDGTSEKESITEDKEDKGQEGQDRALREVFKGFLKLQAKEQMPCLDIENQAPKDLLKPVLKSAVVLIIVG